MINDIRALCAAGRWNEAESICRAHITKSRHDSRVLWLLGEICYETGRRDEARILLGRAVASAEARGTTPPLEWRLSLGAAHQERGAQRKALKSFTAAIDEHPESVDAHFCLATALQAMDQPDGAIEHYRIALKLQPANALAANNLGILFRG